MHVAHPIDQPIFHAFEVYPQFFVHNSMTLPFPPRCSIALSRPSALISLRRLAVRVSARARVAVPLYSETVKHDFS
jgi:hypothetical protein